ncbi:unnamed protein product [Mytilus edulis]|uniref:Peptidoglycan binding-like domain-containing protein n=1 Tax=Mytilus edulis TaxID=6550 RepID=A0A8S3VEE3_MYTED|nr:unnamed protein product [Mytilus edulis]
MHHSSSAGSSKKHSCTPQKSITPKRIRTLSPMKHSPASFSANDNTTSRMLQAAPIRPFADETSFTEAIQAKNADEFFMRFGYMKNITTRTRHVNKAVKRKEAIRKFQQFNGMNITGELDEETIEKIKQPRCGVADFNESSRDRPLQFNAPGYKWSRKTITWKVTGYTNQIPNATQR